MFCVNCHQKQVILLKLLQDSKNPAYGMSDWNVLDKALWSHGVVPTRAGRRGYVLSSTQTCKANGNRTCSTQRHGTNDISLESCVRSQGDAAFERMLDPIEGSPATGKSVARIMNLFVDDPFGKGGTEMERVLARLTRKRVQVVSEAWNDVLFTGQRICCLRNLQSGPCTEVSQELAIEELEEIPVDRNMKEDLHCTPTLHTRYRSLVGQINGLQSRARFQCCCKFSRCASKAASPTNGDVNCLNKLARQLKTQPVKLQCWPLTGTLRIIGFFDASYRNNEDGSSQRGVTVFLADLREHSSKDGISYGSICWLPKS